MDNIFDISSLPDDYLYAAKNDARAVELLIANINEMPEIIGFHAAQAGEKLLKNALEKEGVKPPKIHDIDKLLYQLTEKTGISIDKKEEEASHFLSYLGNNVKYIQLREESIGSALKAIYSCNVISDMLERNGYDAVHINVNAEMLHDFPELGYDLDEEEEYEI